MTATPRVLRVNVGRPRRVVAGRAAVETAIWKAPVAGRVAVRGVNLDGDDQADRSVHGGPDKAVYAYAVEEIGRWEAELGRDLGDAPFGENLTTEGVDVSGAVVGERWTVGTTLLEVAQPRMPCFKLGLRIADPGFVKRFAAASRPGAYLRILTEGELAAGDAVEVTHRPAHGVTVRMVADAVFVDPGLIPAVLQASQLPLELRHWLAGRAPVADDTDGGRASPIPGGAARCEHGAVSRSVLVVDDDASFRGLATRILTAWGHTVVGEAGGVEQALQQAAELAPDLALVDIGLPDGDGFQLTRQLRAMPSPPQVVLISSDGDHALSAAAHRVGASGFFPKDELSGAALHALIDGVQQP